MSTTALNLKRASFPSRAAAKPDSLWFALAMPVLMAILLALVPVLGATAKITFLAALVPLAVWTAFTDTEKAIYVYFAWCWMDGTIRGCFDNAPVSIVARDIVLGVVVLGWAARRLQSRQRDPVRIPPGTLLIILFVVNCFVQVFNPNSLSLVNSLGGLKVHLGVIPLFFVGYDTFRRREQTRSLFVFLTLATLVIGAVSFIQYTQGCDWTWAHFPGTQAVISQNFNPTAGVSLSGASIFKPPGTTNFGGGTASFVGTVFPFTFALLLLSRRAGLPPWARPARPAALFAFTVILFINGLRSAVVEAVIGCALVGFLVGGALRLRTLAALAFCLAVGMVAYTYSVSVSGGGVADRFASTFADPNQALHTDRQTVFDEFLSVAAEAPMGVGLGRTGAAAGRLGGGGDDGSLGFTVFSESYIDTMIFETGLLGAFFIMALAVTFAVRGCAVLPRLKDSDDKLMAAAMAAFLVLTICNFAVVNALVAPPGSVMFWLIGAVMARVYQFKSVGLEGTST